MIAGLAIKAILGRVADMIPWKYIVIAGLAVGLFFAARWGINHYNTLVNDNVTLKADRERLTEENQRLEERNKSHVEALERTIKENQERESDYAENIRLIERQTETNACSTSPAILESLRLRRERRKARSVSSQ